MVKRKFRKRIHPIIQSKMRGLPFIGQKTRRRNTHISRLPRIEQRDDQKPVPLALDPRNFGPNISRQILYQTEHYRRVQQNSNSKRPRMKNCFYN
jgi:hypothetical protein